MERLLAAHVGGVGHLRQRQDRGPHRLQPVHDRADHRVRPALRADGADHAEPAVDRRQRRRHRPGRARLQLPDGGLRDQLRQPASTFGTRALSTPDPGHPAPRPVLVQPRRHPGAVEPPDGDRRVVPQPLHRHHRAQQRRPQLRQLHPGATSSARSTAASSRCTTSSRSSVRRCRTSTPATPTSSATTTASSSASTPGCRAAPASSAASTSSGRWPTPARPAPIRTSRLYCDQWDSGIPWARQFKLAGTYPLPWWGITASISLQSLMGYVVGTRAIPYGVFTFGTGFDVPNGQGTYWNVLPTTRYAANCPAPCRPGRAGHPQHEPDVAERAAARAGDRVHAALQPARPVVQQDVQHARASASCPRSTSST